MRLKLSVIIITKNESENIVECLESVYFADEIIVVDSGSEDDTCMLARQAGAIVYQTTDWPGFGPQKNRALSYAKGQWVLSLDADERISKHLAQEIKQLLALDNNSENIEPIYSAYEISRLSCYAGRWMQHAGWHPDYVLRLFQRKKARFSEALVHESVRYDGPKGRLKGVIYHYPYDSADTHIQKMNHYSSAAAKALHERGKTISIPGVFFKMFWTFIRVYLIRRAFLDGKPGLMLALMAATGNMFRYSKLWFLNEDINWKPALPSQVAQKKEGDKR